jgi:hypothetical protein
MIQTTPKTMRLHDWITKYANEHDGRRPGFIEMADAGFNSLHYPHNEVLGQKILNWCQSNLEKDDYVMVPLLQFKVIAFDRDGHLVTIKLFFSEEFAGSAVQV